MSALMDTRAIKFNVISQLLMNCIFCYFQLLDVLGRYLEESKFIYTCKLCVFLPMKQFML